MDRGDDGNLDVRVTHAGADTVVVRVSGEVDLATAERFAAQVLLALGDSADAVRDLRLDSRAGRLLPARPESAAPATGDGHLVVDLGEVTFLGSIGVRVLLELHGLAAERGRAMHVVTGGQHAVERPLQLIGLSDVMPVHEELDEALRALAPRQ